ncbi:DUF2971 domain-containing protein [Sphingobacterium sp. LRF_L2]|uniref:DUF2971 domain-containing protein n=1 Tax=Sphingobacterium sp. LRF_L2 TaxID=3369421 RepID=UPI003F5DC546
MPKLYKYRGNIDLDSLDGLRLFDRDLQMIQNNEVYFSKLANIKGAIEQLANGEDTSMNDVDSWNVFGFLKLKKAYDKNTINHAHADARKTALNSGVYALSDNYSYDLMWENYGAEHKGYCIEYEIYKVKDFGLRSAKGIVPIASSRMEQVRYAEKVENFSIFRPIQKNINNFLFHANKVKSDEREWRITTSEDGLFNYDRKCLKSITFGEKASNKLIVHVMKALLPMGIKFYQIYRSEPKLLERRKI